MRVFVTGATGLIGGEVCRLLVAAGHEVVALSRSSRPRLPALARAVQGNPVASGAWQDELAACDACIHLAGEPVAAGRWTPERKRSIRASRVESARRVAEVMSSRGPRVLVSGSGVGYYGARKDEVLDEAAAPGSDFLASVCREWEETALSAAGRARVVVVRTGLVLARGGGALPRLLLPFRFYLGGPVGTGEFWQSWIHLADQAGLIAWALENSEVAGPLNATAPEPARNRDLARAIGRALRRPSALSVPVWGLRLALGELSSVVATGQRVIPQKALMLGYRFRFPALEPALADLLCA
ncbi:MAG TPA: TIGR01777 family oxidoreductase [Anaeromyxobacteraceae bacterium]|nr:TIGR01777 family oxidoreductase [Anaeromyxobacteraceae bacterium]